MFGATHLVSLYMQVFKDDLMTFILPSSFELVYWVSNELRALLFAFCNPVALAEQIVVDLVGYDAVLLVMRVLRDKLPHPLGHGHELACFR